MKILVLTKRQYMAKDLIDNRFGRFRELPLELACLGHQVRGLALSYRQRSEGIFFDSSDGNSTNVTWHSVNLLTGTGLGLRKYLNVGLEIMRDFQPDIIWACSDAYHAILGRWLAQRARARCVIDLYDDFETFAASRLPGVLPLFRRAIRGADGVSVFSHRLARQVKRIYNRTKPTFVVENGIRRDLFYPRDRNECRQSLGLPVSAKIIGTAGALAKSRGIEALFKAFNILSAKIADLHLAFAGPRGRMFSVPAGPRVHDFRELPHASVPLLVNAMDVAIVCYRRTAQGEVSFPQKAYEILACEVPIIAAAVGSMNELLSDYPHCLYDPEDPEHLARVIERQLASATIANVQTPSWSDAARLLESFFRDLLQERAPGELCAFRGVSGDYSPEPHRNAQ